MPPTAAAAIVAVPPVVTPEIQADLYREADARFAAQTGITRKLDPRNKLDQKWIPVWLHIYAQLHTQWQHGTIAWTHRDPVVTQALDHAAHAGAAAASELAAMQTAAPSTPEAVRAHAEAMSVAQGEAALATGAAAAAQHAITPPTASLDLVTAARDAIARALGPAAGAAVVHGAQDTVAALQGLAAPAHVARVTGAMPIAPIEPGACGIRAYVGVTPARRDALRARLAAAGMTVAGTDVGPWDIDTHEYGVQLRASWDPTTGTLTVAIAAGAGGYHGLVTCDAIWSRIEPILHEVIPDSGPGPRVDRGRAAPSGVGGVVGFAIASAFLGAVALITHRADRRSSAVRRRRSRPGQRARVLP